MSRLLLYVRIPLLAEYHIFINSLVDEHPPKSHPPNMMMFRTVLAILAISTATVYADDDSSSRLRGAVAIPELIGAEELVDVESPCIGCCTYYGPKKDNCSSTKYCSLPVGSCRMTNQAIGACATKHVACVFENDPQCGCDGKTYASKCMATGNGVNIKHRGACRK